MGWHPPLTVTTVLTLYQDRTFEILDGGAGRWTYDRGSGVGTLDYTVGCLPLYVGTRSGTTVSGEVNCRDGSGGHGTWTATYVPPSTPATTRR